MPDARQAAHLCDAPATEAACLLMALLAHASPNHFLELRLITPEGRVAQQFHQVQALRARGWVVPGLERWDGVANIYHSVVPRTRRSGTAADCAPAPAVWADMDQGLPSFFSLSRSVLTESSPGKYQALWLLDVPCADLARIESLNHAIVAATGADRNACDSARVLRLPGFRNLKYADRPWARLWACDANVRYSLPDLEAAYPPPAVRHVLRTPQRPLTGGTARGWLDLVFAAICQHLEAAGHQLHPARDGGVGTKCPFHDDHNPSLSLHPERGWKCFAGCGQGRLTALAARLGIRVTGRSGHGP